MQYRMCRFQSPKKLKNAGLSWGNCCINGEKIDIVIWKESVEEFVSAVLSPAKVKSVEVIEDENTARVIVGKSQLSLAIGKNGQNARLAAKLTGMRVEIKTENSSKEDSLEGEQSE